MIGVAKAQLPEGTASGFEVSSHHHSQPHAIAMETLAAIVMFAVVHHLYWPDLDIDLAVESIRHPEKFPLVSRVSA
jgi:hypothetical protein